MKIHLAELGVRMNVECEKSYFFVLNWLLRWYQPDEREGGGGYSWKLLAVMCRPFLQILTLLQTVTGPWLHFYFFHGKSRTKFTNFCYLFQQVNKVKQINASKTSLEVLIGVPGKSSAVI